MDAFGFGVQDLFEMTVYFELSKIITKYRVL